MDTHKCKLCSRYFNNGRALGGHMKSHLSSSSSSSLTRNKKKNKLTESSLPESTSSSSSSKPSVYVLRENPKRSRRVADLDSVSSDVESETESECPKRVKRPSLDESMTESPVSSVSDTSPEVDLAMCLVMLSRGGGAWKSRADDKIKQEAKLKKPRKDFKCEKCVRVFGSYRTLGRHRKICSSTNSDEIIFKCPICDKMFSSGQALGGHKRSHLVSAAAAAASAAATKPRNFFIDLNLPAPLEDESSSVIS